MGNIFIYPTPIYLVVGSYTGDGELSQAITGLGGQPKFVTIYLHPTGEGVAPIFEKLNRDWGQYALYHPRDSSGHGFALGRVISFDEDGFTVGDGGVDDDPNANGMVYDYIAFM